MDCLTFSLQATRDPNSVLSPPHQHFLLAFLRRAYAAVTNKKKNWNTTAISAVMAQLLQILPPIIRKFEEINQPHVSQQAMMALLSNRVIPVGHSLLLCLPAIASQSKS